TPRLPDLPTPRLPDLPTPRLPPRRSDLPDLPDAPTPRLPDRPTPRRSDGRSSLSSEQRAAAEPRSVTRSNGRLERLTRGTMMGHGFPTVLCDMATASRAEPSHNHGESSQLHVIGECAGGDGGVLVPT
ncbi:hypothetical protein CRUP_004334, partial [Coryphaenoides rupestris]